MSRASCRKKELNLTMVSGKVNQSRNLFVPDFSHMPSIAITVCRYEVTTVKITAAKIFVC